jgi:hypothetical protein
MGYYEYGRLFLDNGNEGGKESTWVSTMADGCGGSCMDVLTRQ